MSQLLLDTHVFIWFSEDAPNLPTAVREKIESADSVYLSIVSLWEIAIKISIGKLSLQTNYHDIEAGLVSLGIELIPISFADTTRLIDLPLHHRDPFDRLLIVQAIERSLLLVSADEVFDAYPVQLFWQ
jgi:PIN domain nuclease of toxin-antitoxin system